MEGGQAEQQVELHAVVVDDTVPLVTVGAPSVSQGYNICWVDTRSLPCCCFNNACHRLAASGALLCLWSWGIQTTTTRSRDPSQQHLR